MKSLTVKVNESLYRELDRYVRRQGRTKNDVIGALIEAFLRGPRGISGSLLHESHPFWRLIGTIEDRSDVSENVDAHLFGKRKKA